MGNVFEDVKKSLKGVSSIRLCREFLFEGFSRLVSSKCRVLILKKVNGRQCVICSQLPDYYGTSITNAVEIIRDSLINSYGLEANAMWYEHYPVGLGLFFGEYSLMEVRFDEKGSPSWGSLTTWRAAADVVGVDVHALAMEFEDELN
ncbi:MAG: hypothetical protein O9331_01250 [Acidovorax sp.]|nr:hypothetical protein [Acidovorax sp.]